MKLAHRKPPTHKHVNALISEGYSVVAGVDEVGRGCLAGPVTAAAVILRPGTKLTGVRDSKLMTPLAREQAAVLIKQRAVAIGIGWVSPAELDEHGLTWAVCQSGLRALADLGTKYDAVLLDGNHNYLKDYCYSRAIIKADQFSLSVAAASVVAKVARDHYMTLQHLRFPQFAFGDNKGYGTRHHQEALVAGLTPLHRASWKSLGGEGV